ncbi:MAG TPA: single-stranded DNA-binding protein [Bacillota bacterium]|nr:single-stranded DNA-binding protein [Bacillota bacterium]HPE38970.1 single-stranded DNA-binding protein [Bacillota bacterium]
MNKVFLLGRLTRDPEVKKTGSDISVCSFTVAVDRRFKNQNGERQADFINCVAWRQQADLIGKYFNKGSRINVIGSLQSRSYDDADGKKRYVTEVVVDEIEFVDTKSDNQRSSDSYGSAAPAAPKAPFPVAQQIEPEFSREMDDDDMPMPFDTFNI